MTKRICCTKEYLSHNASVNTMYYPLKSHMPTQNNVHTYDFSILHANLLSQGCKKAIANLYGSLKTSANISDQRCYTITIRHFLFYHTYTATATDTAGGGRQSNFVNTGIPIIVVVLGAVIGAIIGRIVCCKGKYTSSAPTASGNLDIDWNAF